MRSGFEENSVQLAQSPLVPPYPGPYTIPILVDDVKQLRDFNMTRGSFFTIDASGMGDDWVAILRESKVPFMNHDNVVDPGGKVVAEPVKPCKVVVLVPCEDMMQSAFAVSMFNMLQHTLLNVPPNLASISIQTSACPRESRITGFALALPFVESVQVLFGVVVPVSYV